MKNSGDERFDSKGDFTVGGCLYSELREDLTAASKRIIRNSPRIRDIAIDFDGARKKRKK